jgi:nucleoside-diphosphate-sugar epimerase
MPAVDAVVIGYGPVGSTVAAELLAAGRKVRVVTRSGSGPDEADRVQADALDAGAIASAIGDAPQVFVAFHAPYSAKAWAAVLPRMEASVLGHTRTTGAPVAIVESLYAFDGGRSPFSASSPLQPRSRKGVVRRRLIEARAASGARVVSVVAGDFYGPWVLVSHGGERLVRPVLLGRTVRPMGDPDQPHAFAHMPDLARALIAAAGLPGDGHELVMAPNAGSVSMRELVGITARAAGVPVPRIAPMTPAFLHTVGVVVPILRELADVQHQFTQPFEVDTRADEARLGVPATPWEEAAAQTVAWWRQRLGTDA